MRIYLVRHAQSKSRDGLRYDEAGSVALTRFGLHAARLLARYFTLRRIECIVSSPLMRAKETAMGIAAGRTPVSYDDRLAEHAPSRSLTGRAFKEARVRTRREPDYAEKDGESFNQAADRFIAALESIRDLPYGRVVVVSHALIMEAALTRLFSLNSIPAVDEASVTRIDWEKGSFHLVYVNRRMRSLWTFYNRLVRKVRTVLGR